MVVPNEQVKKFLLDLINQSNFPGSMSEFVSNVKAEISEARVGSGTQADNASR